MKFEVIPIKMTGIKDKQHPHPQDELKVEITVLFTKNISRQAFSQITEVMQKHTSRGSIDVRETEDSIIMELNIE